VREEKDDEMIAVDDNDVWRLQPRVRFQICAVFMAWCNLWEEFLFIGLQLKFDES
jgi:hypothetical protein